MRLKVFEIIDATVDLLESDRAFYESCLEDVRRLLRRLLREDNEMVMEVRGRIKGSESLREKIIRNRFYMKYERAEDILESLSDLIGVSIECRFIHEESELLTQLRSVLSEQNEEGFWFHPEYPQLSMDIRSHQPQIQKNGFSIYRIDGHYRREGRCVNVELQIKSLVDTFWGEIEHKLVYKNANYYVYDDFMKELLASLKASLTIVDRQMNIIFNEMQDTSKNNLEVTQNSFESLITKGINDIFNRKLLNSVGFSMNIKNTSKVLGHYIFLKDAQMNRNQPDRINALFYTFRKLNSVQLDFTSVLTMEGEFASEDVFIDTLGKYLISVLNSDYDWYVFFRMLFAIEPGNNINDFRMFLSVIKNYLVDDYWLNTSFVRLPMEDAKVLQRECLQMLADSLVHIGTIHILHDDKMSQLNRDFVLFVEELEQRTISYRDFMQYREAYHEEWLRRCALIFGRQ